MHFTIVGAGALGSILGAHLSAAGHEVVMVARGTRAAQVRESGLRLAGLSELAVPCAVATPESGIAARGVLVFAVKTYQMQAALAACAGSRPQAVFSLANGVLKNAQLVAAFGAAAVLGCMANVSGELLASGTVAFTRNVRVALGPLSGYRGPPATELAGMLDAAGIRAAAVDAIETVEWSKFVGWLAMFTLAVIARTRTCVYLENETLAGVVVQLVREAAAIAQARGIALVDQSPLPVASVSTLPWPDAVALVRRIGRDMLAQAPDHRMSALQDLEAGRVLEVHETLGFAVSEAARLGLAAPALGLCYQLAAGIDGLPRGVTG